MSEKISSNWCKCKSYRPDKEAEIIYNAYKNMYDRGIRNFTKVRFSLEKML